MAVVQCISDLQSPFHHPKALDHLRRVRDRHKPDKFVVIGDSADMKFLKFAGINDPYTAEQQHEMTLKFHEQLYREFPSAYVCECNHVYDRILNVASDASIPSFLLKTPREFLNMPPGWLTAEKWEIDGVVYEHGHRGIGGKYAYLNAVNKYHKSIVFGHHPILAVRYIEVNGVKKFGMCVGALCTDDQDKRMGFGMSYSKNYAGEMPRGSGVVHHGKWAFVEPLL